MGVSTLTATRAEIITTIRRNPGVNFTELARSLGCTRQSVYLAYNHFVSASIKKRRARAVKLRLDSLRKPRTVRLCQYCFFPLPAYVRNQQYHRPTCYREHYLKQRREINLRIAARKAMVTTYLINQ